MGFLDTLTGANTGKATINAAKANNDVLAGLKQTGVQVIDTYTDAAHNALNQGIDKYAPYADSGAKANNLYGDALGLNGADGNTRATGAFQTGPGYEFARDAGEQSALRGASAAGMLNSGNTLTALSRYGQGLANQEYGGWLDRLQDQSAQGLQAAGGQAGGFTNIANLLQGAGDSRLGLEGAVAQGVMGNNNQSAAGREAKNAAQGSFFGNLLSGGIGLATKAATGGLI